MLKSPLLTPGVYYGDYWFSLFEDNVREDWGLE